MNNNSYILLIFKKIINHLPQMPTISCVKGTKSFNQMVEEAIIKTEKIVMS